MTAELRTGSFACPGCLAAPAEPAQVVQESSGQIALTLPGIHCQGCISTVERTLKALPDVQDARVNLTLKRALITGKPEMQAADLIAVLQGAGFEAHELDTETLRQTQSDQKGRDLLMRLAVAGFAMMNVMLLSISVWSGASDATRDMFHWVSAAIALPAIAFSAQPFFENAWSVLRVRRLNMDVPIVLAIILALFTSLWETSLGGKHAYFDAALALTFFLLAGRYLDFRTRAMARSAAKELAALEVPRAIRLQNGKEIEVSVSDLACGDLISVRPGGRMPVDGIIVDGHSELDRSLLTGETLPVFAGPGTKISAGEVNLTGPLTVLAIAVGQDTSLHRLADLVAIAESGRLHYTSMADKAAKLYAPGVHILSALSFLGWLVYSGDMRTALNIAAAVLIITCPCALGLAVPAVTTAASGRLFRKGLLIKNATALERLAKVDTVVFDKTGTLTIGTPEPVDLKDHAPSDLAIALGLAEISDHPLSASLTRAIRAAGIRPADVTDRTERPGFGTTGRYRGTEVRLGRAEWTGADATCELTTTWLAVGDDAPIGFQFEDALRPGAVAAVSDLIASGKQVILLSGDTPGAVERLAQKTGINRWSAGALPEDKSRTIQNLTLEGHHVLMVGDGLNDTAALAAADVSISPASALDAARVASDIVLLGNELSPVAEACDTARKATLRIRENFQIATIYNIIAVPLAVAGLATPLIAALAMSTSSITVSLNALRLR